MSRSITRRDFIKLGGAAFLCLAFRDFPFGVDSIPYQQPSTRLGRTIYSLRYYEQPTTASRELGYYIRDTVVKVHEERVGSPENTKNPIWFRTDEGWLHSAYVQPVDFKLNVPVTKLNGKPMLVETTVPYTQAWKITDEGWKRSYRFYYGSTFWVHYVFSDDSGQVWYQVYDERLKSHQMVIAEHMRPISAEELTPISPNMPDKLIEVDLERQILAAYEGDRPVFVTPIASGYYEGDTPRGQFSIERKQPTRHMASELNTDRFDLPGVPWVCYIFWSGISIHGTYWHNNYGKPQSHGCINLKPEAAKWIYRWSEPYLPLEEDIVITNSGTRVIVK